MELRLVLWVIISLCCFLLTGSDQVADNNSSGKNDLLMTPKIYAKIFAERRREHNLLTKEMLKFSYEKNYKLLNVAYSKVFELLREHNSTLIAQAYSPLSDGFPQEDAQTQTAVTLILENCALSAVTLLHFPEISYRIFKKTPFSTWKETMNWCIEFVNAFPHIIDESTAKLMELLQQEINEELRREDYVNPYYEKKEGDTGKNAGKHKKPPKKLKKGPQLSGGRNEL